MSALGARSIARTLIISAHGAGMKIVAYGLRDALFYYFLVDFRKAKIKKGISHPAGCDLRLCLKTPRPFEKGRRKLYFACGREFFLSAVLIR